MPRMKNAAKPSKSPYKKISTLHTFGFTSPKGDEKNKSLPKENQGSKIESDSPVAEVAKKRGRPPKIHRDYSGSRGRHQQPAETRHQQPAETRHSAKGHPANASVEERCVGDVATRQIKKETLDQYATKQQAKVCKGSHDKIEKARHTNLNGASEMCLKSKHSRNHNEKPCEVVKSGRPKDSNDSRPPIKLKISFNPQKADSVDDKSLHCGETSHGKPTSNKDSVFTPPGQLRGSCVLSTKRTHDTIEGEDSNSPERSKQRKEIFNVLPVKSQNSNPTAKTSSIESPTEISDSDDVRSRRLRKPSQKMIELLESDLFTQHSTAVVRPSPVTTAKRSEPVAKEESRVGMKCDSCGITNKPFMTKFQHTYCHPCSYMWSKYLFRNVLPECDEGCDHNSIFECHGCRSVAFNASVPPDRRIRLRKKDSRRRYVEAAIALKEGRPVNAENSTETSIPALLTVASANSKLLPTKAITLSDEGLRKPLKAKAGSLLVPTTKITALQSESVMATKMLKENPLLAIKPANTRYPDGQARPINLLSSPLKGQSISVVQSASVTKQSLVGSEILPNVSPVKPKMITSILTKNSLPRSHDKPTQSHISTKILGYQKPAHVVNHRPQLSQILVRSPQVVSAGRAVCHTPYTLNQLVSDSQGRIMLTQGGLPVLYRLPAPGITAPLTSNLNTPVKSKDASSRHILQIKPKVLAPTLRFPGLLNPEGSAHSAINVVPKAVAPEALTEIHVSPKKTNVISPKPTEPEEPVDSGPRVKHVSRSATMAQGQPAIVQPTNLRLSALPPDEKCKIWNEEQSLFKDYSDEEIEKSKAAKLDYDWDPDYSGDEAKRRPKIYKTPRMKIKTKFVSSSYTKKKNGGGTGSRRPRCGVCAGCHADNCRVCVLCKDMKKYGGPGRMKQCCIERRCVDKVAYRYTKYRDEDEGDYYTPASKSSRSNSAASTITSEKRRSRPSRRHNRDSVSSIGDESWATQDSVGTQEPDFVTDGQDILVESNLTNKPLTELLRASNRNKQTEAAPPPPVSLSYSEEPTMEQSLMTADGTLITDQNPGFSLLESFHRLMADFIDTYDIDKVWEQGVAVVTSSPQSVRVLCYLCGSGGQHQLTYCTVCCEPFHNFCLEERDRPKSADGKDWLCRNCRFCQVCGKLDDLLTCDRCTKTYHPECLGDGYTIQPTSAGIWVCNSCVKCTSCGATTPGGPDDKWNTDFSLCATCEALRLKGNYCPICRLCYSDDDWDCKMIGCSSCESWTHSKCENLPDDLYQLIGYVGDDEAQYVCKTCLMASDKPIPAKPDWLIALEKLRTKGFSIVCVSILDKKYAQSVAKVDETQLKIFYDKHKEELIAQQKKRSRSLSPTKPRSPTKNSPSNSSAEKKAKQPKVVPTNSPNKSNTEKQAKQPKVVHPTNSPNKSNTEKQAKQAKVVHPTNSPNKSNTEKQAKQAKVVHPTNSPNKSNTEKKAKQPKVVHPTNSPNKRSTEKKAKQPKGAHPTEVKCELKRELSVRLNDIDVLSSSDETPSRPVRSSRKTKKDAAEKSIPAAENTPGQSKSARSQSLDSSDLDTPIRKSSRFGYDSQTHSTPVVNEKIKVTKIASEDSAAEVTPRRSGREKKNVEEVTVTPKEVQNPLGSGRSADKSLNDISSSSLLDGLVNDFELNDLSVRFKDVEWETPNVTFESLKASGHPMDVQTIQDKVATYMSVNDFIDDVVRVLQGAITRSRFEGRQALKSVLAVKKLFEQEVTQLFPWCEVHKSGLWEHNLSLPRGMLEQARLPPSSEHTYALWLQKPNQQQEVIVQPSPFKLALPVQDDLSGKVVVPFNLQTEKGTQAIELIATNPTQISMTTVDPQTFPNSLLDTRRCQLCSRNGDDAPNDAGRLVYCGADDWIHVNCALWSAEVFEEVDGTLQKVHAAVARGKMLDCSKCGGRGATVGCCAKGCTSNFHFICAKSSNCCFMDDKQVFCASCQDAAEGQAVAGDKFSVMRTVTVDFAHAKIKKPWQKGFKPSEITVIAGSLTVENLGTVIPESDYLNLLVPIDYCVTRIYWSTKTPYQRCVYTCKVVKVDMRSNTSNRTATIPDMTICHDPDRLEEYTAPEFLTTRYPTVFHPEKFAFLQNVSSMDYDPQVTDCMLCDPLSKSLPQQSTGDSTKTLSQTTQSLGSSWPHSTFAGLSERTKRLLGYVSPRKLASPGYVGVFGDGNDSDLANLTGIARALNKAAHRSRRKKNRQVRKKAAIMYGSVAPEVSGNLDDDVSEILDMVTAEDEEVLDEREVIILRDVDDDIAREVVDVIGKMSKEEADEMGGVQAVMQSILNKHKHKKGKIDNSNESSIMESLDKSNADKAVLETESDSEVNLTKTLPKPLTYSNQSLKRSNETIEVSEVDGATATKTKCILNEEIKLLSENQNDSLMEVDTTFEPGLEASEPAKSTVEQAAALIKDSSASQSQHDTGVINSEHAQSSTRCDKNMKSEEWTCEERMDVDDNDVAADNSNALANSPNAAIDHLSCLPGSSLVSEVATAVSRPHSAVSLTSSASSLMAYSSASSADYSPSCTDAEEEGAASDRNGTLTQSLMSPPKIVITDCSFDHPTDITDEDPFQGVKQTSAPAVSHGTKDKLKSLVQKRSESFCESDLAHGSSAVNNLLRTKRRSSMGDLLEVDLDEFNARVVENPVRPPMATKERTVANDSVGIGNSSAETLKDDDNHIEVNNQTSVKDSSKAKTTTPEEKIQCSKIIPDNTNTQLVQNLVINKSDKTAETSSKVEIMSVDAKDVESLSTVSVTEKDDNHEQIHLPRPEKTEDPEVAEVTAILPSPSVHSISPPESPKHSVEFRSMSFSGRFTFTNNFYEGGDDLNSSIDSHIVIRDRTPVVSDSDDLSDSSTDDDHIGRIIVPPSVNCLVRDTQVTEHLPSILNAKVLVAKLPPDSDSELETDMELSAPAADLAVFREPSPPPLRDISRDVRKDMINYCEESADSSTTDEEDLCKPRISLRRRDEKVNYNEERLAARSNKAGDGEIKPKRKYRTKPMPMTGKVVLNKDGSIKSRTENIPSELQKTISDAIRKARNKEASPTRRSSNQAYAGSGAGDSRGHPRDVMASRDSRSDRLLLDCNRPRLKANADKHLSSQLNGANCQLAMMSPSTRKRLLPPATAEEEIAGGLSMSDDTRPANQNKPSSTVLAFEISSDDGFKARADNWNDAWRHVTDAVRELRIVSGCPAISFGGVKGLHMFGLEHTSIAYFTEQLYGARYCHSYRFKFHNPPLFELEEELPETASGCCRSESFINRKPTEMFSFIDSKYRKRPVGLPLGSSNDTQNQLSSRRATSMDLPMAMRFRHLKTNAREASAVYRSPIHGRGLFCRRVIDSGEMIIEYAGEVIRHELCDKREKYYDRRSIGCYMFRIDDDLVVDATMKGNAARFINHSCDPNCFSKVIDVTGTKHIVIFALRSIQPGEELTYDYKFPFEEVKIPCSCGAKKCRGFLN